MAEPRRSSGWALLAVTLTTFGLAVLGAPSCLEPRQSQPQDAQQQRCASCHGDAHRDGDFLARSAPPFDLLGRSATRDPGVGAHAVHLTATATHAAVPCQECHVVPETVDAPGHADDARPAELSFGKLATAHDHTPHYDYAARSCVNSYCHGQAEPRWTQPRASDAACGACHGLPPALPHPQSERCSACHGDVIDEQRHFKAPARHIDGVVDFRAGDCSSCHGGAENAAPPRDIAGHSAPTALGVGAHQAHLSGGSAGRPVACPECHTVPEQVEAETHADGLPAEVALLGVAEASARQPTWNHETATCSDSWCHAPSPGGPKASPTWNADRDLGCQSCHGMPPAAPHPQLSNCSHCHADVVGSDDRSIIARERHVDGHVDVNFDQGCSSCHGSAKSAAPPTDVSGSSKTSLAGVGAHQAHVLGTPRSRKVDCETCHIVPKTVLASGHIDSTLPAEITFSGALLAFGANPRYSGGSCQETSCHGASFPNRRASGGSNTTPTWTKVDGSQAACGSCHGLPPPPPHPYPTYPCHSCHGDIAEDDVTFTHPELHVDGVVTFAVP